MPKVIIGIHGLGNKPPHKLLEKWWLEAICEGLQNVNGYKYEPDFEMVYWADILNDKPLNSLITDSENPYFLDEPYLVTESDPVIDEKPTTTRQKFLGFLEDQMDKLFLNEDLSANFEFVSDLIFKKYFKELEVYYAKQPHVNDSSFKSVQTIIRNRLADVLRKHEGKDILLIGHSMGSIIAYDVCNFVVPKIKINTLVTMGSPLGIPIIISRIAEELKSFHPAIVKLQTPPNVREKWFNYADVEDSVALNYSLADDFDANKADVKVTDTIVKNNYIASNQPNPHKSYGYLRAPEFSNMLSEFLNKDYSAQRIWWINKKNKFKKLLAELKH